MLYQPDGQKILHPGLSAFIRVHPVIKGFYNKRANLFATMMHADGHRCNDDSENCGWLCDTASKPSTLLACRQQRVIQCPKGWILTGCNVYQPDGQRTLYPGLSAFICVHPVNKMLYNKCVTMIHADGRRCNDKSK